MNLFGNIFLNGMSVFTYVLSAVCAIVCGLLVALVTSFKYRITKSFFASLIVLPYRGFESLSFRHSRTKRIQAQ